MRTVVYGSVSIGMTNCPVVSEKSASILRIGLIEKIYRLFLAVPLSKEKSSVFMLTPIGHILY